MKARATRRPAQRPALLDVNFLIALIDGDHQFHASAHQWFDLNRAGGWATCPLTENGCIRILSKPGYPFPGLTADRIREILTELTRLEGYRFWTDSVSILEPGLFQLAGAGPRHLTDIYLLGLAVRQGGKLVTFDRSIRWQAVNGGTTDNLEVLRGDAAPH
jgi:toxin-antitoxin system PIN domain toxin